jgi:hypothetical protein
VRLTARNRRARSAGPNGNLFVVSLSNEAIYEIFRVRNQENDDRN